jgi:hypothetical protein
VAAHASRSEPRALVDDVAGRRPFGGEPGLSDGARHARLARLFGSSAVVVEPLDDARARAAGQLCGVAGTRDVIDAAVVLGAKARGDRVFTSDVDDLRELDPTVELVRV